MVLCFFSKVVVFEKGFEILVTLGEKGRKEEKPTETRALREYGAKVYKTESTCKKIIFVHVHSSSAKI